MILYLIPTLASYRVFPIWVALLFMCHQVSGQTTPRYADSRMTFDSVYSVSDIQGEINIPLPPSLNITENYVKSAEVLVTLRTGPNYTWGSSDNLAFQVSLDLSLAHWGTEEAIPFAIHNEQPEVLFALDFTEELSVNVAPPGNQDLVLTLVSEIDSIRNEIGTTNMTDSLFQQFLNELEIVIHYEIEYGIAAVHGDEINLSENTHLRGRYYTFSWDNQSREYPEYQFQLIRLYNYSSEQQDEQQAITTFIDWEQAMDYFVGGSKTSIVLAIAEGAGFYAWRVRPIGTFYPGGVTDARNYGEWSRATPAQGETFELSRQSLNSPPIFYFEDPDEDKNWIYSRIFTEEGKVHESMTFANDLLQVKQEQSYFPSQRTILTTQHVQDFSGRTAMSTLPVPVPEESGLVFQERFIRPKNSPAEVYAARHFDADSTYRSPLSLEDSLSAMQYYSSNNPDLSIPDASGYAYSRALFHNDGTGRVQEQSGVGPTHMISDDPARGKTVTTQYAVPSEDELIRIFGSETPNHESVRKVITTDENGTATIQYITNTGNLIATCMTFVQDEQMDHILPLDSEPDTAFQVTDRVTRNIPVGDGLYSSRRITLVRPSPLNIEYRINCKTLQEGCQEVTLDCGYQLQIVLHNLSQRTSEVLHDAALNSNCEEENQQISIEVAPNTDVLPPGEYVIEKRLIPAREPSSNLRIHDDSIKNQITPLTDLIINELESIERLDQMDDFYDYLRDLADYVNDRSNQELIAQYSLPDNYDSTGQQFMTLLGEEALHTAIVGSSCCTIEIPIYYTPAPICDYLEFDANGVPLINSYPAFGEAGGFENYAIEFLAGSGCISEAEAYQLLYTGTYFTNDFEAGPGLLSGWNLGQLDEMILKMLTDEYSCGLADTAEVHYSCDEVMSCWTGILSMLREQICQQKKYFKDLAVGSPSDAIRADTTGGAQHDSHIREESDKGISWPMSMFFPDPVKAITDAQTNLRVSVNHHLVRSLLDCTGYHFAAIFPEGHNDPMPNDGYTVIDGWQPQERNQGLNSFIGIRNPLYAWKYFHYDWTHPSIEVLTCFRHPDSCFNGQELVACCTDENGVDIPCDYCGVGRIKCEQTYRDWNCGQRYAFFEKIRNTPPYDPNVPLPFDQQPGINWTALCEGVMEAFPTIDWTLKPCQQPIITLGGEDSDYQSWQDTCGFYLTEQYFLKTEDDSLINTTLAGELIVATENKCLEGCAQKRQMIRDSLLLELNRKCYITGGCLVQGPEKMVPLSHVDQMVDALVGICEDQCSIGSCNCRRDASCRPLGIPRTNYGYGYMQRFPMLELGVAGQAADSSYQSMYATGLVTRGDRRAVTTFRELDADFSFQEAITVDQATNWFMQIELPSRCGEEPPPLACDPTPHPIDSYGVEAKARLNLEIRDELDWMRTDEAILPTLKSPKKRVSVTVTPQNNTP